MTYPTFIAYGASGALTGGFLAVHTHVADDLIEQVRVLKKWKEEQLQIHKMWNGVVDAVCEHPETTVGDSILREAERIIRRDAKIYHPRP